MYRLIEVDGEQHAEVLRNLNGQCPTIFPPLSDDHLATGWWWVLKSDHGILCGFCGLIGMEPFPGCGYLKRAYVSPDHRGKGLQLKMLEAREAKARELGWHLLVTETTNPHAAHNFERAGFEHVDPEQPWGKHGSMYFVKHLTKGASDRAAGEVLAGQQYRR